MSLKAFHVAFVVVSTLLMVVIGVWGVRQGDGGSMAIGVGAFLAAIGLVVYGAWFLRKMKGVAYL